MKGHFDQEADVLYLRFDDSPIAESEEVHPGVVLDFNAADQIVAIEIRGLQGQFPAADLEHIRFEVLRGSLAEQRVPGA